MFFSWRLPFSSPSMGSYVLSTLFLMSWVPLVITSSLKPTLSPFPFFPQRNLDHVWSLVPTALLTLVVSSGCEPRSLEVFLSVVQGACGLLQVFSSLRRQDSLLASRLRFLLPGLGHSAQLVDKWYGEQLVTMPLPVLGTGHPIGAAQTPDL